MKKFNKKDLYESEQGRFKYFVENKLETSTEYNAVTKYTSGKEEEAEEEVSIFGGDFSDFGSGLGDSEAFGEWDAPSSFGGGGSGSNALDMSSWKNERSKPLMFLKAPFHLVIYVIKEFMLDSEKVGKRDWKPILPAITKVGFFMLVVSLLGHFTPFHAIMLNTSVGMIVGLTFGGGSAWVSWKKYNDGILTKFIENKDYQENVEEQSDGDMVDDFMGDSSMSDFNLENPFDLSEDGFSLDALDATSEDDGMGNLFADEDSEEPVEKFASFLDGAEEEDEEDDNGKVLRNSTISSDDKLEFENALVHHYNSNYARNKGKYIPQRKELITSFSELIVSNDDSFKNWKKERERSVVYCNIAYTLYKALSNMTPKFESSDEKLVVMDIQSSPLMYKVSVKLPNNLFKKSTVTKQTDVFEQFLKESDIDTQVQCLISVIGDTYVFRILRLDYKGLISLGDLLRYVDDSGETAYEKFVGKDFLTPMVLGLKDNEYPWVVDLEKNTAMAIAGGSGSGKSWFTYLLGLNLALANDPQDANFLILDAKNSPFWDAFARLPHVLGYHTQISTYTKLIQEVVDECKRRQELLKTSGYDSFSEARKTLKKKNDFEELAKFPLLVVVIDELTYTMGELITTKENAKRGEINDYDLFRGQLARIAQVGRSAGVRLLTIGQRTIDTSLPRNVKTSTSMRFAMKLDESDINTLFDNKAVENIPKPTGMGQGIINSEDYQGFHMLKTVTPGGKDEEDIRSLLRTIAFDWINRADGRLDLSSTPDSVSCIKEGFNRDKFLEKTQLELSKGNFLQAGRPTKGFNQRELVLGGVITPSKPTIFESEPVEEEIDASHFLESTIETEPEEAQDKDNITDLDSAIDFSGFDDFIANYTEDFEPVPEDFQPTTALDNDSLENTPEDPIEVVEDVAELDPVSEVVENENNYSKSDEVVEFVEDTVYDSEIPEETNAYNGSDEVESYKEPSYNEQGTIGDVDVAVFNGMESDQDLELFNSILSEYVEPKPPRKQPVPVEPSEEKSLEDIFESEEPIIEEPIIERQITKPVPKPQPEIEKQVIKPIVEEIVPKAEPIIAKSVNKPVVEKVISNPIPEPVVKKVEAQKVVQHGVQMRYGSTPPVPKKTVNISVQQYIIKNGIKVGSYSKALPISKVEEVFSKRKIINAITVGEIVSDKDTYIAKLLR